MPRAIVRLSPKLQTRERRSNTICAVVERPDHLCGDDLFHTSQKPHKNGQADALKVVLLVWFDNIEFVELSRRISTCIFVARFMEHLTPILGSAGIPSRLRDGLLLLATDLLIMTRCFINPTTSWYSTSAWWSYSTKPCNCLHVFRGVRQTAALCRSSHVVCQWRHQTVATGDFGNFQ